METSLDRIENDINYPFRDSVLLGEALHVPGSRPAMSGVRRSINGNKRLALIGNCVMKLLLAEEWYATPLGPTDINRTLHERLSYDNLAQIASNLKFEDYVVQSPSLRGPPSRLVLATALEAVVGAVWIDSGDLTEVFRVMQKLALADE